METRKVNQDGRKWLSPWHLIVFSTGGVAGAILSAYFGAAYTAAAVIVVCWILALMLVASDRTRVPRLSRRRERTPARNRGGGAAPGAANGMGRGGGGTRGTALNVDTARRARLRPILGGKSEPPSRAS